MYLLWCIGSILAIIYLFCLCKFLLKWNFYKQDWIIFIVVSIVIFWGGLLSLMAVGLAHVIILMRAGNE